MREDNQTIIKVIGVCVLIVLVTILATVLIKAGQGDATVPAPITPSVQAVPDNASMTAVMRDEYMNGCMGDGTASETYCVCTYNHLNSALGTDGLMELSIEYVRTNELPPEMLEAAFACLEDY